MSPQRADAIPNPIIAPLLPYRSDMNPEGTVPTILPKEYNALIHPAWSAIMVLLLPLLLLLFQWK